MFFIKLNPCTKISGRNSNLVDKHKHSYQDASFLLFHVEVVRKDNRLSYSGLWRAHYAATKCLITRKNNLLYKVKGWYFHTLNKTIQRHFLFIIWHKFRSNFIEFEPHPLDIFVRRNCFLVLPYQKNQKSKISGAEFWISTNLGCSSKV